MSTKAKSPFKETAYFTSDDYSTYSRILNIPTSAFTLNVVGVTDFNDEYDFVILNFHYHPELVNHLHEHRFGFSIPEIRAIQQVRGIVVDTNTKQIADVGHQDVVCRASPITTICVRNSVPTDGTFTFDSSYRESNGIDYADDNIYKEWIYGTLIRIFCYNNVTFLSTNKKLSCANSHFGNSRKFQEIFFGEQDVFTSPDEIFKSDERNGLIHLFILNDKDLITDSSEVFDESRIYYICSFDIKNPENNETEAMTRRITEANQNARKPIYFPRVLEPTEVNEILSGGRKYHHNFDMNSSLQSNVSSIAATEKNHAVELFRPAERVFMANMYGIYAVVPPNSIARTYMMDGKAQVTKIYADCMSDMANSHLNDKRMIIPYGFTYDQLLTMKDALIRGEDIDFSQYEDLPVSPQEIILTNLVFFSPRHKVEECFDAYVSFGENVIKTAEYLWEISTNLKNAIISGKLDEFPGLKNGSVQLKRYLQSNFCACLFTKPGKEGQKCINDIIGNGVESHWNPRVVDAYNKNTKMGKKTRNLDFLKRNALICFVVNAPGDVLFALFKLEDKITRAKAAFAKRASSPTTSPPKSDEETEAEM